MATSAVRAQNNELMNHHRADGSAHTSAFEWCQLVVVAVAMVLLSDLGDTALIPTMRMRKRRSVNDTTIFYKHPNE
uniref:Uncharacterized protein n=1 Tax=Glossina austeni TaxID=7395 RepID=A0A1A9V9X6_GLOAU